MSPIRAIQLERPGQFVMRNEPTLPERPSEDHVQVAVKRVGICGTDIHAFHGRQPFFEYPRVLGHELGVEILAGQELPSHLKAGMACAVRPYMNDEASLSSRRGRPNCCESMRVLGVHTDGGMRPFLSLPTRLLHPGPGLSLNQLALVEMLSIGYHAVQRARPHADDEVVVLGAGPIGMSVVAALKSRGHRVVVADLDEARLAFCKSSLGVEKTVQLGEGRDSVARIRAAAPSGGLPNVVFDATGNPHSMAGTFDLAAHGGTIVLVGLFLGDLSFHDPDFHRKELTLMASRNATADDFEGVMREIRSGALNTDPWITHRLDLLEVPEKFAEITADPTLRKAMITIEEH